MPEIQASVQPAVVEQTTPAPTVPVLEPETEKPTENPDDKRFASRFAALSKREKQLIDRERAIKTESETFKAEQVKMQKVVDAIAKGKENPVAVLEAAGITYDYLTRFILNNNKVDPEDKLSILEKKIEEDKQERLSKERAREEAEVKAQETYIEQMIDSYRKETHQHILSNPEQYELIIANDAKDEVFSLIVEHFAETGQIMPPDEAAQKVEEYLFKEIEKTILSSKKFASKLAPVKEEATKAPSKPKVPPKTLSNNLVMSDPVGSNTEKQMTREERLKAAASKLRYVDRP